MCGYVCTRSCVFIYTQMHTHVQIRITLSVILQKENSFAFLEKWSVIYLDLTWQARLATEPQESSCLGLLDVEFTNGHPCAWLLYKS